MLITHVKTEKKPTHVTHEQQRDSDPLPNGAIGRTLIARPQRRNQTYRGLGERRLQRNGELQDLPQRTPAEHHIVGGGPGKSHILKDLGNRMSDVFRPHCGRGLCRKDSDRRKRRVDQSPDDLCGVFVVLGQHFRIVVIMRLRILATIAIDPLFEIIRPFVAINSLLHQPAKPSAQAASRHPPPWAGTLQVHFSCGVKSPYTSLKRAPLPPSSLWGVGLARLILHEFICAHWFLLRSPLTKFDWLSLGVARVERLVWVQAIAHF